MSSATRLVWLEGCRGWWLRTSSRKGGLSPVRYLTDVGALARKDLLLELRAKETVPAMLLFVLSTLTVFHFALPRGTGHVAASLADERTAFLTENCVLLRIFLS